MLQSFTEDLNLSIRDSSATRYLMPVHKILKQIKFYPYKIHLVQALNDDDFDHRYFSSFFQSMYKQKIKGGVITSIA